MADFTTEQMRYFVSHVGKSLLWVAADLVTIYALVTIGGHHPHEAGLLFLIGMGANACADMVVGYWLDRHPGHARRIAAAGLLVAATAFPLTMIVASSGSATLLAATLAFRIAYSAYDVPHNALLSSLARTSANAVTMSRLRTLGTGSAAALVGAGLHRVSDQTALIGLLLAVSVVATISGSLLLPLLQAGRPAPVAEVRDRGAAGEPFPVMFLLGSIVGTVGLAMLAKGMLHLPRAGASADAGTILILLTSGRTLAALVPVRLSEGRRGLRLLACSYGLAAIAIVPIAARPDSPAAMVLLGLMLGTTNLVAWTTLPLVTRRASGYGLYTMSIKIALGLAGVLMTAVLGPSTAFTSIGIVWLSIMSAAACLASALLLFRSFPSPIAAARHRRAVAQQRFGFVGLDHRDA